MDNQYSIRFTGRYLKLDQKSTAVDVASFFPKIKSERIEALIDKKVVFKKNMDLVVANEIKSRIEAAGAECLVFLETDGNVNQDLSTDKQDSGQRTGDKKSGLVTIIISVVLMVATLLLSSGYEPRLGFFWSLSHNMYLVQGYPFGCPEVEHRYDPLRQSERPATLPDNMIFLDPFAFTSTGGCSEAFFVNVKTKDILVVLLCLIMFGVVRYFGIIQPIRYYWERVKKNIQYH